jgi:hypothetical protein
VRFGVMLARFLGVLHRVQVVAVRNVRVVPRFLVIVAPVMLRRPAMVLGGGLVVLGGLLVMLGQQALVHDLSSSAAGSSPAAGV